MRPPHNHATPSLKRCRHCHQALYGWELSDAKLRCLNKYCVFFIGWMVLLLEGFCGQCRDAHQLAPLADKPLPVTDHGGISEGAFTIVPPTEPPKPKDPTFWQKLTKDPVQFVLLLAVLFITGSWGFLSFTMAMENIITAIARAYK